MRGAHQSLPLRLHNRFVTSPRCVNLIEGSGKPRQIDVRSVRSVVARRLAEEPRCGVLLEAHKHASMGTVVRVVDEAKLARENPPVPVRLATAD